ncbi:hypothetical protein F0562_001983 [Nyssa sinensis]|uniref:Retropepsins domain-containing protein n=1 Tax=Nyssa sinensis TaxID=561372 RepID=A0A5J5C565_9ASTE|nr:hypothetical protein F0562_001983 [Nyssa sinensis]
MTVTTTSDEIELGWVEEADKSLSLMAMPKETSSSSPATTDEKEELFNVQIQIKQEVIGAIVDTGSQKNLIFASLVQKLGLDTIPHPKPYPLGWIQKDMELKIDRQCTFQFAITNQYIDEITCEVQPILHKEYVDWYVEDPKFRTQLADIQNDKPTNFVLRNGLLYKGTLLCIPQAAERLRVNVQARPNGSPGKPDNNGFLTFKFETQEVLSSPLDEGSRDLGRL